MLGTTHSVDTALRDASDGDGLRADELFETAIERLCELYSCGQARIDGAAVDQVGDLGRAQPGCACKICLRHLPFPHQCVQVVREGHRFDSFLSADCHAVRCGWCAWSWLLGCKHAPQAGSLSAHSYSIYRVYQAVHRTRLSSWRSH